MGLPKRLTEMQKKFCEYLVFGGPNGPVTKTEAAALAGYSEKRARQEGYELTNPRQNPLAVQYASELREERLSKHAVTYEGHLAELDRIKEKALSKNSFSTAGNMEIARGKAAGLYIEQKIIRTGKLEDLTSEELENRMKTIIDEYSPILEGVDEKELKERVLSKPESQKDSS